MKLIKPSVEIIEQSFGINGLYKHIEYAGRTCYKSHNLITEDSAKKFVDNLIKSGHGSVLEHGTVYLAIPINEWLDYDTYINSYTHNPYSKVDDSQVNWENWSGLVYITTNVRVLVENDWLDDLKYLCEPTEFHEKRITVKFICDIGVSREFNRHN